MAILGAARDVFARAGFSPASVEEIARRAQVGKGTIYEHFGSKEELFLAVCADVIRESVQRVQSAVPAEGNARTRLIRLWKGLITSLEGLVPLFGLYFEAWSLAWTRNELRLRIMESFRELYDPVRDLMAGLIREGQASGDFQRINAKDAASLMLAVVDGLAYESLFLFRPEELARLSRRAEEIFFSGLDSRTN